MSSDDKRVCPQAGLRLPGHLKVAVLLLLFSFGCQPPEKPRLDVHPVSGKVLLNGRPPARAEVTLRPATPFDEPGGRSIAPYGIVQKDGTFTVGSYTQDDGAPPGDYAVTITWPKVTVEGGEEIRGEDRLRGQYAAADHPAARFTVRAGPNEVPTIELKSR